MKKLKNTILIILGIILLIALSIFLNGCATKNTAISGADMKFDKHLEVNKGKSNKYPCSYYKKHKR